MIALKSSYGGQIQTSWLQGPGQIGRPIGDDTATASILNAELNLIDQIYNWGLRPLAAVLGAWHAYTRYGGKWMWAAAGGVFGALMPIISTGVVAVQSELPKLLKPRIIPAE